MIYGLYEASINPNIDIFTLSLISFLSKGLKDNTSAAVALRKTDVFIYVDLGLKIH